MVVLNRFAIVLGTRYTARVNTMIDRTRTD